MTAEQIAADRKLWPGEVTVAVPLEVPLSVGGKPAGSMKMPAGRTLKVSSVSGGNVVVLAAPDSPVTVAVSDTDLVERSAARQEALTRAAEVAASRTPLPTATPDRSPSPTPPPAPAFNNPVGGELDGHLVALSGRKVSKYQGPPLAGHKYLAIYFSAHWCGPCRQFTPELVNWYEKTKKKSGDLFELVFVSRDRSEKDMEGYIEEAKMPWPAVDFSYIDRSKIRRFAGRGIPCLVLVGPDGSVLSHSYEGDNYVGPGKVMQDLDKLLRDG